MSAIDFELIHHKLLSLASIKAQKLDMMLQASAILTELIDNQRLDAYENEDTRYWGLELLTRWYDEVDLSYLEEEVSKKYFKAQEVYAEWLAAIQEAKEKSTYE